MEVKISANQNLSIATEYGTILGYTCLLSRLQEDLDNVTANDVYVPTWCRLVCLGGFFFIRPALFKQQTRVSLGSSVLYLEYNLDRKSGRPYNGDSWREKLVSVVNQRGVISY